MCVGRCVSRSADCLIFEHPLEQPRVVELWQIVTVVYFVSFGEDRNCDGKKLQGHGQQIVQHMQGTSQRLHAVAPSTRGYSGIESTQGFPEDMDVVRESTEFNKLLSYRFSISKSISLVS